MRTTLSLDDDVVVLLDQVRKLRKLSLKQAANDALRAGLQEMTSPRSSKKNFRTRTVHLGRCYIEQLDNITETLSIAEGESFQ
jgi:hypothetical protein